MEFFQSQVLAKNSQARGLCHPESSYNELSWQKRTLFKDNGKASCDITFSGPAKPWVIRELDSPNPETSRPFV
jgi:hypothetical protein